jgi:hypothetical protein
MSGVTVIFDLLHPTAFDVSMKGLAAVGSTTFNRKKRGFPNENWQPSDGLLCDCGN